MRIGETVIILNYCGILAEIETADTLDKCTLSTYNIVLRDIQDPRITIHFEGVTTDEIPW